MQAIGDIAMCAAKAKIKLSMNDITHNAILMVDKIHCYKATGTAIEIALSNNRRAILFSPNTVLDVEMDDGDNFFFFHNPLSGEIDIGRCKQTPYAENDPVIKWFCNGNVGASSRTLIKHLMKDDPKSLLSSAERNSIIDEDDESAPLDHSDMNRCVDMLYETGLKFDHAVVAAISPEWHAIADSWDTLNKAMSGELPFSKGAGTTALLRELRSVSTLKM